MSASSLPSAFDDFVDRLRREIGRADDERAGELHPFRELIPDAETIPESWWDRAFDRLDAQGHLHRASGVSGGGPHARLSDAGHTYLESQSD